MDTDTLFFAPPKDLWVWFDNMSSSHLVAMVPDAEEWASGWYNRFARHPFFGELGVNSGAMLMHLERMRERRTNWTSTMEAIFHRYYKVLTWGDQDILNIYFHSNPGTCRGHSLMLCASGDGTVRFEEAFSTRNSSFLP